MKTESLTENDQILSDDLINESQYDMAPENPGRQQAHVTVCDINQSMLDAGQKRADKLGYDSGKHLFLIVYKYTYLSI